MTQLISVEGASQVWAMRFPLEDGRMCTHFVPVDEHGRVMSTNALKHHVPDWIGMNFVTLTGKLFLKHRTKLIAKRRDVDDGSDSRLAGHPRDYQPGVHS